MASSPTKCITFVAATPAARRTAREACGRSQGLGGTGHGWPDRPPPRRTPASPSAPHPAAATAAGTTTTSRTRSCTPCKSWPPSWSLRSLRTSSVTWGCKCRGGRERAGSAGEGWARGRGASAPPDSWGVKPARLRGRARPPARKWVWSPPPPRPYRRLGAPQRRRLSGAAFVWPPKSARARANTPRTRGAQRSPCHTRSVVSLGAARHPTSTCRPGGPGARVSWVQTYVLQRVGV